jgi:ribosome-binding factor A
MFIAFLVDAVVWYKAPSIQFHEDNQTVNQTENVSNDELKLDADNETVL